MTTIYLGVPEGLRISPWLRYHSDAIVGSLSEAQAVIRAFQAGYDLDLTEILAKAREEGVKSHA